MTGLGVRRLRALIVGLPSDSLTATSSTGWTLELELAAGTLEALDRILLALGGRKGKPIRIPRPEELTRPAPRPRAETPDEVVAALTAALGPSSSRT